jgi:calcineurin-like phosphoesterase family protein
MTETFFVSDNHFFHKKILFHCPDKRGNVSSIEELNEKMIEVWNNQVKEKDTVYCLGDFSFGTTEQTLEILRRLNGRIHLVMGNHDYWITKPDSEELKNACLNRIQWIDDYKRIKINKQLIVLFHYPIQEWYRCQHGSWHLHGHCHGNMPAIGKRLDVGIDNRETGDMKLFTFDEIRDYMNNREEYPRAGR